MTLADLRTVTQEQTTVWLEEKESGNCLAANELRFIGSEHDGREVVSLFPERYPAISAAGITVIVK